ncbi:TolC family protein [Pedobacter nyackensis]|uniref:TolC family protein n=1 Tax=Pedobacter nyackensis TaxID=475255 RepID=UPI00292EA92D|nr:TolC family protein [Pedobacter nyackensis]
MKTTTILIGFLIFGLAKVSWAQDSLRLDLRQAEQRLIKENYQLIAQNYQTEQAKADIITARLFDNPELSYENLFYNRETKKFFETSMATGQYAASLSQLFKLAGKRNKNIQLATAGAKISEYEYFDLMRTLRYELRSTFYKAYYSGQSVLVYQQQINALKKLLSASEQQLQMGNIAVKDVLRIKSLLYNLQTEYSTLLNDIEDLDSKIKLMTNIKADIPLKLELSTTKQTFDLKDHPYISLLDSAKNNRADLQLSKATIRYTERNLNLQKAMAVPDVELSLSYDLKGNYPEKYTGFGIKIPIPLFNRNQGEIKKARVAIAAGQNNLNLQEASLENEVYNSYKSAARIEELYQSMDHQFNADFQKLITEVTKNFSSRNISLIEFLDFYDSYKENTLQMNTLSYERMNAKEEINYVTGSSIFK